jgi:hypothetical protein
VLGSACLIAFRNGDTRLGRGKKKDLLIEVDRCGRVKMNKGFVDKISRNLVAGWAVDALRPDDAIRVCVLINGQAIASLVADITRADLVGRPDFGNGRHGFRFEFKPPLRNDQTHRVSVFFENTGEPVPNGERTIPSENQPRHVATSKLSPILITGPGRTGTTLLMSILAKSDGVIAADLMPYETRHIAYYANAQRVLSHPADNKNSTHQDRVQGDGFYIGFNPYNAPFHMQAFGSQSSVQDFANHYVPAGLDRAFADLIEEYYKRLSIDRGKPSVRFFAEKNNNLQRIVRLFNRRAFTGAKEIVTIRDPRDIFCSHLSYFKFDPSRIFAEISHAAKVILEIREEDNEDIFFCNYYKLASNDLEFFSSLEKFLGVAIAPNSPDNNATMFARHATSDSLAGSLSRWRTELSEEWRERCQVAWRPFLEKFGYDLT